ncbi:ogr/Delta-like zinc finger family protein [Acinetobacter sp. ANC 3791]|uniref:ogr/Delta-like zinc finger family protein n=1 Tax=Acinetobacter sp. ANC 3791 TaxID=2529836 RepID=UPI00103E1010|nr:ogr/Delta-like zinc finger family protein [Acinetobacter sp. ANC 3791]TCB86312.1 transcriptional regulator [Acinetobacter sp. ANC 3791]
MANTRHQNHCPFCGDKVIIRSTTTESPLLKTLYGQCQNLDCGWTGKAHMEWAATISPSAIENKSIHLPRSIHSIQKNAIPSAT